MNIKYKILIFLITYNFLFISAQNICGKIVYEEESNLDLHYKTTSVMIFNDTVSYSKYLTVKEVRLLKKDNHDTDVITEIISSNNDDVKYVYTTKYNTYFTDNTWEKTLTVKEDKFNWNWKILEETKTIGSFNCQKASIIFRGRKYFAWFTHEIPVFYGPWKFKKLPGLILEVYDSERLWSMRAKKVTLNTNEECEISFDTQKLSNALSIKDYLIENQRLINEDIKRFASQLPKGVKIDLSSKCFSCDKSNLEIFPKISK